MAQNGMFELAKEALWKAQINGPSDTVKALLVDLDQAVSVAGFKAITGATNASPIVITSTGHGVQTGNLVCIVGVGGNTNANTITTATRIDANTFSLDGVAGNAAYTSGGFVINLSTLQYLSDIPSGARVATSGALASKTFTLGVFDAADFTFTAATGAQCEAIVLYQDTGTAGTSRLIGVLGGYTGLPATPNGGDIGVTLPAAGAIRL